MYLPQRFDPVFKEPEVSSQVLGTGPDSSLFGYSISDSP